MACSRLTSSSGLGELGKPFGLANLHKWFAETGFLVKGSGFSAERKEKKGIFGDQQALSAKKKRLCLQTLEVSSRIDDADRKKVGEILLAILWLI